MTDDHKVISVRSDGDLKKRGRVTANVRGQGVSEMVRDLIRDEANRLGVTLEVAQLVEDESMTIPEALAAVESEPTEVIQGD